MHALIVALVAHAAAASNATRCIPRPNQTQSCRAREPLTPELLALHMDKIRGRGSTLWAKLDEASAVVKHYAQGIGGTTWEVPEEIEMLVGVLAKRPRWGTICEIGMNAGHSSHVWLHSTGAQLKVFDLFERQYSEGTRSLVEAMYPGRATFFRGGSDKTVKAYAARVKAGLEPPCDLWFIDGGHDKHVRLDFRHALASAAPTGEIIADDCTKSRFPLVRSVFEKYQKERLIVNATRRFMPKPPPVGAKGWCVGRWNESALGRIGHGLPADAECSSSFGKEFCPWAELA